MSKGPQKPQPLDDDDREPGSSSKDTLPGWPGYRTRPGRSGYDPIDSRAEGGHILGILIRRFFTIQIRTRNPVYLFLLAVIGLALVFPLIVAVSDAFGGRELALGDWLFVIALGIAGLAALANVVKNLAR